MKREASQALTSWYSKSKRSLPWRDHPTGWGVLLSELMLQQTRVATVLPYWRRFMERFPTPESMAAAELDEVESLWAGLGYYRRARNLHRCAVAIAELGGIPRTAAELRELPGIGPYTSGAVASIAFGEAAPLVDGNVERVIARVIGLDADVTRAVGKKALWASAADWMASRPAGTTPGEWNQALMELGGSICTPKSADCPSCPLRTDCDSEEDQALRDARPHKPKKKKPVPIAWTVFVVRDVGGRMLLGKRPRGTLLGGQWTPPWLESGASTVAAELNASSAGQITHVFSHRRLTATVKVASASSVPDALLAPLDDHCWSSDPAALGLSALGRKVIAASESPQLVLLAADPS